MKHCYLTAVAAFLITAGLSQTFAGTQGQYPAYSGNKRMAIIMLAWQDKSCPATRQNVVDKIWNNDQSLRKYFLAMSRDALDFIPPADAAADGTVSDTTTSVYGPYTLSEAEGFDKDVTYANCETYYGVKTLSGTHSVARDLATSRDGFNASDYDYIMYITPKGPSTGAVGGYAGMNSTYSHLFVLKQNYVNHEIGHNLGLAHSNTVIDKDGYGSQDCIMGNQNNPHLDAVHTYNQGWYPDANFSAKSYGQYTIENLAQPDTDNLKVVRFDRSAHGASSNATYDIWVAYRVKDVGHDSGLHKNWDKTVNIHYCRVGSLRPYDDSNSRNYYNNNVAKFLVGGSYIDPDSLCKVMFLREETAGNASAVVQFIDPNGNQPPTIPAGQVVNAPIGTTDFTIQANDPENDALTFTIVSAPAQGTLNVSGETFTFTTTSSGSYTFTVRANDGQYDSPDQVIALEVVGVNPPTANAGADQTVTITEGTGGGTPVAGAYLEYDASQDTAGDATWNSTTANAYDWTFNGGALSPVAVSDPRFDKITKAYAFPAAKSQSQASLDGSVNENSSGTWEFVLDTDADDGLIFETGGTTDGVQFWIVGGELKGEVRNGGQVATVAYPLTAEDKSHFIHIVYVIDMESDLFTLYVDGQNVSSMPWTGTDWSGGNDAGLGRVGSKAPAGNSADFSGKMALIRFYESKAFTSSEVTTNFNSLYSGYGAVATLEGAVDDPDNDPLNSLWAVVSGPGPVIFANSSSPSTTALFTVAGTYVLRLTTTDGLTTVYDEVTITVNPDGGSSIVDVDLPAGISLYGYTGESPVDAQAAFQTLIDNSQLSLVRWVDPSSGGIKELYYTTFPSAGWVNEIGDLTLGQGYVVKTAAACTLAISGNKDSGNVTHDLPAGYSMVGYNKETPADAQAAFQELITAGKLELVRWVDPSSGAIKELYYTTFPSAGWVNEIGDLTEGQGYIIKLSAPHPGFVIP